MLIIVAYKLRAHIYEYEFVHASEQINTKKTRKLFAIRSFNRLKRSSVILEIYCRQKKATCCIHCVLCFQMANIEVSLSSTNLARRRKGTSLGGGSTISSRSGASRPTMGDVANNNVTVAPTQKEHRNGTHERESVVQKLRMQLGLGKSSQRSTSTTATGTPLEDSERPAAEQRLTRLRKDSENKQVAIRNLKAALTKLDVSE